MPLLRQFVDRVDKLSDDDTNYLYRFRVVGSSGTASNALMIIILFLLLALFKSLVLDKNLNDIHQSAEQTEELAQRFKDLQQKTSRTEELERQVADLRLLQLKSGPTSTDAPPIIVIEDQMDG